MGAVNCTYIVNSFVGPCGRNVTLGDRCDLHKYEDIYEEIGGAKMDDTPRIQAAIDGAASSLSPKVVPIRPVTIDKSNVSIIGNGMDRTVLRLTPKQTPREQITAILGLYGFTIRNNNISVDEHKQALADAQTAILAVIKGLPAMQEETEKASEDAQWTFTEKVDGTNIRVSWDGKEVVFGGRTDSAQIPNGIINRLNDLFYSTPGKQRLREVFPEGGVVLYGEGYGAKIQKGGGNYKDTQDFVLFDVRVGDIWLERENVQDVASKLGCDVVPVIGSGTLAEAIALVKGGLKSTWGDFEAEGIVARPVVELLSRRGQRIITKIKVRDFR